MSKVQTLQLRTHTEVLFLPRKSIQGGRAFRRVRDAGIRARKNYRNAFTGSSNPLDTATAPWYLWADKPDYRSSPECPKVEKAPAELPGFALVLRTVATDDQHQNLLFGFYCWARREGGAYVSVTEGVFYSDSLGREDIAVLGQFCSESGTDWDIPTVKGALPPSHTNFMELFWKRFVGQRDLKGPVHQPARAFIAGWNLPLEIQRLAFDVTKAKRGGFSFTMSAPWGRNGDKLDTWRPNIVVFPLDGHGARMRRTVVNETPPFLPARFLDLDALTYALAGQEYTLGGAARVFGVPLPPEQSTASKVSPEVAASCLGDLRSATGLLNATLAEFASHPIDLLPEHTYSSGAIASAYLGAMGVTPPLALPRAGEKRKMRGKFDEISTERLGQAMAAFHGGRAECRIQRTAVLVVYLDFLSQYSTVNVLLNTWGTLRAASVRVVDCTEEARALVEGVGLDQCFNPLFWPSMNFFAEVEIDGDILPNGIDGKFGVNPLHPASVPVRLWAAGPDVVAAKITGGKTPRILQAWKLVPEGVQEGLTPIRLRGEVPIDPRTEDFFRRVVEERKRAKDAGNIKLAQFLKVFVHAGEFGQLARLDVESVGSNTKTGRPMRARVGAYSDRKFNANSMFIERPGSWYFPLLASLITAGGRLLLAMLERLVSDSGGTFLFCDTDSMAIVASEHGGPVPCKGGPHKLKDGRDSVKALSWKHVRGIVDRFGTLNPYDRTAVPGSILKIEDVNFIDSDPRKPQRQLHGFAVARKKYRLYDESGHTVAVSAHALAYEPPFSGDDDETEQPTWVGTAYELIQKRIESGGKIDRPDWMGKPALTPASVSSTEIWKPLQESNKGKPYSKQTFKPFSPFYFATIFAGGQLFAIDPNPGGEMKWFDVSSGKRAKPTRPDEKGNAGCYGVQDFGLQILSLCWCREHGSLGPNGKPSNDRTRGLLKRAPVIVSPEFEYTGKEADKRLERNDLLSLIDPKKVDYTPRQFSGLKRQKPGSPIPPKLLEHLRKCTASVVAERSGLSIWTVKKSRRNGGARLSARVIARLTKTVSQLEKMGAECVAAAK